MTNWSDQQSYIDARNMLHNMAEEIRTSDTTAKNYAGVYDGQIKRNVVAALVHVAEVLADAAGKIEKVDRSKAGPFTPHTKGK